MLNGLDLFSGIGGMSIALSEWVRPIAYCEIDSYCQAILLNRQYNGLLPRAPIWDDISTLQVRGNGRNIDIIYGGFPCQDISIAGTGKGLAGQRSSLCYDIFRIANETKPRWIFLENVPAITTRGGLEVVKEIAKMGYDCRWITITAASVGALHKRERWFLLAHANNNVADSIGKKCTRLSSREEKGQPTTRINSEYATINDWQKAVSEMGKCSDGISYHTHRLRALGNAVVPQQAKEAFKILMGV